MFQLTFFFPPTVEICMSWVIESPHNQCTQAFSMNTFFRNFYLQNLKLDIQESTFSLVWYQQSQTKTCLSNVQD